MPEPFGRIYLAIAAALTLAASVAMLRLRPAPALLRRDYWRWLLRPWKLFTFAIAATGMVVIAPWSGDPTWDHVNGGVQSVLTYLTAPWSVGTLFRALRRAEIRRAAGNVDVTLPSRVEALCAACAWMVSVSWFYDAYLFWRDGRYVDIWAENLFASSALYLLAGLLWSVQADREAKVWFAFQLPAWPDVPDVPLKRILPLTVAIMLFTTLLMAPFLVEAWSALSE